MYGLKLTLEPRPGFEPGTFRSPVDYHYEAGALPG